jgi:hypothetical protein
MPTVLELKQSEVTETPLLLFECRWRDGRVERWSTHRVTVGGDPYEARILNHNVFELRSSFDEGAEAGNRLSLQLANADSYASQLENSTGFKGARLTVRFVFFNLTTGEAASAPLVLFQGIGNAAEELTESTARLTFLNRLVASRVLLPEVRIQKRCPWTFPANAEQRQMALTGGNRGKLSPLYRCGYSADQPGGVGSLNAGQPYTSCDYTRESCEARGMFDTDSSGRETRRFGGMEFVPASVLVRGAGESAFKESAVVENEARYNDCVPLVYGTGWVQPPVIFARNDGNLTHLEVVLGAGEMAPVMKVLVNGVEIPPGVAGANLTATGWHNPVSSGARNGGFNPSFQTSSGHPLGDPYGSIAVLAVVVPNRVADGKRLPRVEVLMRGMKVARFATDGQALSEEVSNNPAWVLLDVLRRGGWTLAEVDLASFARAAEYCAEPISVKDIHGNPTSVPRYQCNLILRKRKNAGEVIRSVRSTAGLYLTFNDTGQLELRIEGNLALQAPTKPALSNSTATLAGGWPAYEFSDSSAGFSGILRRAHGEPSLRLFSRSAAETPNRITVEFQDEFNEYQQDSLSLVDLDDADAAGQEVSVALQTAGLPNFTQAARLVRRQLDKSLRGNRFVEFETSVRGLGLRPGDLITLTYQKEGLQRQPFRILRVSPGLNFRTATLVAQWHDETWYDDREFEGRSRRRRGSALHDVPRPLLGDVLNANGEPEYSVDESYRASADGTAAVLRVGFLVPRPPQDSQAAIPLVNLTAQVASTGGTLAGARTLYYGVSAVDATGAESELSFLVAAPLGAGATYRVTLSGLSFSPGTASFRVYRGPSPEQLFRIGADQPVATAFVDDGSAALSLAAPPDAAFDHANFYWRLEKHPEAAVSAATANTVSGSTLGLLANEHRGAIVRISRGKGAGQERVIAANTATQLTVDSPWDVVPDSTSFFVINESGWKFGALSTTSPVEFEVPNRTAATVQIVGRAASVRDVEAPLELSPLRRWTLGGSGGAADSNVPPEPSFALHASGDGTLEIGSLGFPTFDNTHTITGATLVVWYWDELDQSPPVTLASGVTASSVTLTLSSVGAQLNQWLQVGTELLLVTDVAANGVDLTVERGYAGSPAAIHAAGARVYLLTRLVSILPFVANFFGSPASGSYSHRLPLPCARVAGAEMFVVNRVGNSDTRRFGVTETTDSGLRTLTGGQLTLQVENYLAVQEDATPYLSLDAPRAVRDVFATVNEAPSGGAVELTVTLNGDSYCSLIIADGQTISNTIEGRTLGALPAGALLGLNITAVPSGANSLPGRDLTVTVRL